MKRRLQWDEQGAILGTDPRKLQVRDIQLSELAYDAAGILAAHGVITEEQCESARSAIVGNFMEHVTNDPARFAAMRQTGEWDRLSQLSEGYVHPGESSEGAQRRKENALRLVLQNRTWSSNRTQARSALIVTRN